MFGTQLALRPRSRRSCTQRPSAPVERAGAGPREAETLAQPRMVTSRSDAAVPSRRPPPFRLSPRQVRRPWRRPGGRIAGTRRRAISGLASALALYAPPSFCARYSTTLSPLIQMVACRRGLNPAPRPPRSGVRRRHPDSVKVRDKCRSRGPRRGGDDGRLALAFRSARRVGEAVEGVVVVPIRFPAGRRRGRVSPVSAARHRYDRPGGQGRAGVPRGDANSV